MRLIRIKTLELEEYFDAQTIPAYAILSHRWTSEELNFKEVLKGRTDQRKKGFIKLVKACEAAASYDVTHIWIDTCCIDKRSSAELSEAINSMFRWYECAKICLAYLPDVQAGPGVDELFRQSIWFTRSWTLQELLAPKVVEFFDSEWRHLGSKHSCAPLIESITGIPDELLKQEYDLDYYSVAERMSWAADRKATRTEDVAYSLIGIFDTNMPLLYGEGPKAFQRLQQEIIHRDADQTCLLWGFDNPTSALLASSPGDFREVKGTRAATARWDALLRLNNAGLEIEGELIRWSPGSYGLVIAQNFAWIYILILRKHSWLNAFYRIGVDKIESRTLDWSRKTQLTILRGNRMKTQGETSTRTFEKFAFDVWAEPRFAIRAVNCENGSTTQRQWRDATGSSYSEIQYVFYERTRPAEAVLTCKVSDGQALTIKLSFDFDSRPCALIFDHRETRQAWQMSDLITESNGEVRLGPLGQRALISTSYEATGSASYFLRNDMESAMFSQVSKEMTSEPSSLWVSFIPPWSRKDGGRHWAFKISTSIPIFGS